jgi:hypothetical protein
VQNGPPRTAAARARLGRWLATPWLHFGLGRWLSEPWLHFVVGGALLFAVVPRERPELMIGAEELAAARAEAAAALGRAPDAAEERAIFERAIDEAVLLREAWTSGLPRHDPVVLARLARIGAFVEPGAGDPEAAVERARALGLERSDPVIRRHLIARMRLAIEGEVAAEGAPDDATLAAFLATREDPYALRERIALVHVHVSSRHGSDAPLRAAELGARLAGLAPSEAAALGDPFAGGTRLVATREELARQLGPGFAQALDAARVGRWQGPLPSSYGLHWVWIEEILPARRPGLAELRERLARDFLRAQRQAHLRHRLDALRARYEIRVEPRVRSAP